MDIWYKAFLETTDIKAVEIDWATSRKVRVHIGGGQFRLELRNSIYFRYYPTFIEAKSFLQATTRIEISNASLVLDDLQKKLARLETMPCPQLPS